MASSKPSNKTKKEIVETFVLCNTGASISLAPISLAKKLGMRVDPSEKLSVRGADGQKIKVLGTSYVYLQDKCSPSWR